MKKYNIAVIAGDGIGPEVIGEAVKVLKAICASDDRFDMHFTEFPWGCEYYLKNGEMMPENGLELLSKYDAILLGAVGYPGVPDHISLRNLLLKIRHGFDQYINLRPVKLLKGAPCPLAGKSCEDIDMIFIRENSEGEYSGSGAWLYKDQPNEVVIQNSVFSRKGCERVIRYAYELAKKEGRSLTSVSKANALNYSMVFWDQIFEEVGREYPDVETRHLLVDAASMFMVRDPKRFGVVVTSNLFGDILTDLGAVPPCSKQYMALHRTSQVRILQIRLPPSGLRVRCWISSVTRTGEQRSWIPSSRCWSQRKRSHRISAEMLLQLNAGMRWSGS